jgi:hypothetical protein
MAEVRAIDEMAVVEVSLLSGTGTTEADVKFG